MDINCYITLLGICANLVQVIHGVYDPRYDPDPGEGCASDWFTCGVEAGRRCVPKSCVCDLKDDCGDNSDERSCPCQQNEMTCKDGTCLGLRWKCDGVDDCVGGEDGQGCGGCRDNEWECTNHDCVQRHQRCDGTEQCEDLSDEHGCLSTVDIGGAKVLTLMRKTLPSGQYKRTAICADNWTTALDDDACIQTGQGPAINSSTLAISETGAVEDNSTIVQVNETSFRKYLQQIVTDIDPTECTSGNVVTLACAPRECGRRPWYDTARQKRIVHGNEAEMGQFPWQLALHYFGRPHCGATLIDPYWIVTAGHCVEISSDPTVYSVLVSSLDTSKDSSKIHSIEAMYVHPGFVGNDNYTDDITLIKLSSSIVFSAIIQPACLPDQGHQPSPWKQCYVSGWGRLANGGIHPTTLRYLRFGLFTDEQCSSNVQVDGFNAECMMCGGGSPTVVSSCWGDSGGPLACLDRHDRWTLVGIVSYGGMACTQPGIYTRMSAFVNWIMETIKQQNTTIEIPEEHHSHSAIENIAQFLAKILL